MEKILGLPKEYFTKNGKFYKRIEQGSFITNVEVQESDIPKFGNLKSDPVNRKEDYNERVWRTDYKGVTREFFISKKLKGTLDDGLLRNKNNFDLVLLIGGSSGSGKSTLGFGSIAMYVDKKFTQENIVFCAADLIKRTKEVEDESCLILDESQLDLSNRVTGTGEFLRLMNFLSQVRQRRLKIIIIAPSFFDLAKNICLDRSQLLFYTYVGKGFKRGSYLLFDKKSKLDLWLNGRATMNYGSVSATYRDKYSLNKDFIDEKEYLRRKREFLDNLGKKLDKKKEDKFKRDEFIYKLRKKGMTFKEISDIVGVTDSVVGRIYRDLEKDEKYVEEHIQEQPKIDQDTQEQTDDGQA